LSSNSYGPSKLPIVTAVEPADGGCGGIDDGGTVG
jgi:hypothetical protein